MKRFKILPWHSKTGTLNGILRDAGYLWEQELEWEEVMKAIRNILENGANVMLFNTAGIEPNILWISLYKFGQR